MKKLNLLIGFLFLFCATLLLGQSATMKKVGEFVSNYTRNELEKIDYDNNGNFIALGYYNKYYGSEIFTSKYDGVSGEKLWSNTYFYDDEKNYRANDFDVDKENNIYIAGSVDYSAITFFKYNSEGILIADSIYQNNVRTLCYNIRIDSSGDQIVLFSVDGSFILQKKSHENILLWEKEIDVESPKDILIDSLNSIYILSEYKLIKYTADGNLEWKIDFLDNLDSSFSLIQMKLGSDNKIFLLAEGMVYSKEENFKPYLLKYSSSGENEFVSSIDPLSGIDSYFSSSLLSSSIDRLFVYAIEITGNSKWLPRLVVFDYQGIIIDDFSETITKYISSDSGSVSLKALATDNENNIILGGKYAYPYPCSSYYRDAADFFLMKLNKDGIPLWKTSYKSEVESDCQFAYLGKVTEISINKEQNIFVGGLLYKDYEGNGGDSEKIYLFKVEENISGMENVTEVGINSFNLSQNYPNPFNPSTVLRYEIGDRRFVSLKVYDVLGKEVATLVNKEQQAGSYDVEFVVKNLPSGIYFYRLRVGGFVETKKMVLLR